LIYRRLSGAIERTRAPRVEGGNATMIQLTGVLKNDPQVGAGGGATMTLAANAQVFTVVVSSQHTQWLASTTRAGVLVEVTGALAGPGLVHAYRVRAVPCGRAWSMNVLIPGPSW
jgi:hypothetical protein